MLGQNRAANASAAHCMHAIEIIPSFSKHGSRHCSPHDLQDSAPLFNAVYLSNHVQLEGGALVLGFVSS